MLETWIYAVLSVLVVSLLSLVGLVVFAVRIDLLRRILIYFVSFSAGALFGDVFLHLLPEVVAEAGGFTLVISLSVLAGIVLSFVVEKVIKWRHCHHHFEEEGHVHSFAEMNIVGDAAHNFIDGIIIGASYLISIPVGLATTLAVIFHEIPQEIGDFGILLHGGYTKKKALFFNFLASLAAFLGLGLALVLQNYVSGLTLVLVPFAAGSFLYIAGSDLIPELHKELDLKKSLFQLFSFMLGMVVMAVLLLLG